MTQDVLARIERFAAELESGAEEAEAMTCLPRATADHLRASGVIRMLQPSTHGGMEADPRDFLRAVMAISSHCGSSGWVAAVLGVHPWELALLDTRVQDEVWGGDPDVWIASPYAPHGQAERVDGGYLFNGRWSYSTGTDHCDWIFLGGVVQADDELEPPETRHFVLPRRDYEIVADSWDVVGLRGTGSRDIVVRDAFVPRYRTIEAAKVLSGVAACEAGRAEPLYRTPWSAIFPSALTASIIGMAEGALAAHVAYRRDRSRRSGGGVGDPYSLNVMGEAAAEVGASRVQLLDNVGTMYDLVCDGREVPFEVRMRARRDQVRCAWRAVNAVDRVFAIAGAGALRLDQPLQRFWRDAHAGLNHAIHAPGQVYSADAAVALGYEPSALERHTV